MNKVHNKEKKKKNNNYGRKSVLYSPNCLLNSLGFTVSKYFSFSLSIFFLSSALCQLKSIITKSQLIFVDISWLRGYPLISLGGSRVLSLHLWFTAVLESSKNIPVILWNRTHRNRPHQLIWPTINIMIQINQLVTC